MIKGRSFSEISDSFAFSLFLINGGRVGSRAEREYIQEEKAKRQYRALNDTIKTYKYEDDESDEEAEQNKANDEYEIDEENKI